MIFDDFVIDAPNISADHLGAFRTDMRSRIVFVVEENLNSFVDQDELDALYEKKAPLERLPSPLPYDDIALCCDNAVLVTSTRNHGSLSAESVRRGHALLEAGGVQGKVVMAW